MHPSLLLQAEPLIGPHDIWSAWPVEPLVLAGIALGSWWYARGLHRLRQAAGPGRGLAAWAPWCFGVGLLVVALALCSPMDALADELFAAHMVQHLLLMLVAAPLIALGAPSYAMLWAFAPRGRRAVGRWWRGSLLPRVTGVLAKPAVAWGLSVGALVFWHLPGPYRAALDHDAVHALEHLSFLGTGILFWWVLLRPDGYRRLDPGLGVLYVFTAMLPGGLLGALLTFAGRPIYAGQSMAAAVWGLTPLEDQQLAGLIMWMPGGAVHLAAAAALFVLWLRESERRSLPGAGAGAGAVTTVAMVGHAHR